MSRPNRILAYDALRVFAILSVVAIHTLMPYRQFLPESAPVRVFDDLLHYAVPLFVFISGVFAWGRPLAEKPGAYREFLGRRVSVIAIPFVAWTALYFALLVATNGLPSVGRSIGLLVTGHTWYHLYFVPMLVIFYLLTPIASRLMKIAPELLLGVCYLFRIEYGRDFATLLGTWLGEPGWQVATHVVTHLPHMALGAWFAARYGVIPAPIRKTWPILLAMGTAILLAASLGLHSELTLSWRRFVYPVGMALTVLGMALGAREAEPALEASTRWTRLVSASAPLAFGVYFVHPALLLVAFEAVPAHADSLWTQPWFPLLVYAVVTAGSFAISMLMARSGLAGRLIGIPPKTSTTEHRPRTG